MAEKDQAGESSSSADDLARPDVDATDDTNLADGAALHGGRTDGSADALAGGGATNGRNRDSAADVEPSEREPEPVGARTAARAAGGRRSGATAARVATDGGPGQKSTSTAKAKDRPTARRDGGDKAQPRRTGPVGFVRESVAELRKVVYPTGPQLLNYFVVVLIFVLFVIAYVSLLDLGFGAAIFRLFA